MGQTVVVRFLQKLSMQIFLIRVNEMHSSKLFPLL